MRKLALLVLLALLILAGCTTQTARQGDALETLASLDCSFIVAIDNENNPGTLSIDRIRRLYATFDQLDSLYAIADIGAGDLLANAFLASKMDKTKVDGMTIYNKNGLEAVSSKRLVYASTKSVIPLLKASHMAYDGLDQGVKDRLSSSKIGLYARNPASLQIIGMGEAQLGIREALVLIASQGLEIEAVLSTEAQAKAFSTILKAWYIANLRLDGISFKTADISSLFSLQGCKVSLRGAAITKDLQSSLAELMAKITLKESL